MNFKKFNLYNIIKCVILTIVGTLILAFGAAVFIIPFNLVTGGLTGISIIINRLIPYISVEISVALLSWSLFVLGIVVLGKQFALKTLLSTAIYPIGIALFSNLLYPSVMSGFFNLGQSQYSEISLLLASLLGGALTGTGCAVTFLGGGSTGGVDIIAFTVCKLFKKAKSSRVLFFIDAVTVIIGMFVLKDLILSLLGISSAFISATVIDRLFLGDSKGFIAQIITENYDNINKDIINKLKRTSTIINVTGGFSKKEKKMIMVSFTMSEYRELLEIINLYDKNAFISIHKAYEINGKGWTT